MFITADLGGSHYEILRSFLIEGSGADAVKGSLVEEGTDVESLGAVRPVETEAGPVKVTGLLTQLHDYSEDGEWTHDGTLTTATNRPEVDVDIRPFAVYRSQIALSTNVFDADGNAADTDISLTTTVGAADVLGGSWLYDSGTGDVRFVEDHAAEADIDLNTATSADWDQVATGYWCPQRLYGSKANQGATLNSTHDQILIKGDETVLWLKVVDIFITYDGKKGVTRLNPGIHDAISVSNPVFFIDFTVIDHSFNPLS
jgi:hypothetical protein